MKTVRYLRGALADLRRHPEIAARARNALRTYAENPAAHARNVTVLVGRPGARMRIGKYRIVFEETAEEIIVTRIGPRGSVYE